MPKFIVKVRQTLEYEVKVYCKDSDMDYIGREAKFEALNRGYFMSMNEENEIISIKEVENE